MSFSHYEYFVVSFQILVIYFSRFFYLPFLTAYLGTGIYTYYHLENTLFPAIYPNFSHSGHLSCRANLSG